MRLLLRASSETSWLRPFREEFPDVEIAEIRGNLLNREVCERACHGVSIVYHLAAGRGQKSYPDAFLNSVVTTRNLIASLENSDSLRRFVNVSSMAVYEVQGRRIINEDCPVIKESHGVGEAYVYGKVKQDQLVLHWAEEKGFPYVIVRPGVVFGEGNHGLPGRVGIGTFGVFLHLGGSNRLPLTYVENCADAIALAGVFDGIEGEVFNVVDDDCPTSRHLLKAFKKQVRPFSSIYAPYPVFYGFSWIWEKYSSWSDGQLPPIFNRRRCDLFWGRREYSNQKVKSSLGWRPVVPMGEALDRYLSAARGDAKSA